MTFLGAEIVELTEAVWSSVLDSDAVPIVLPRRADSTGPIVMASIQISGGWCGAVVLTLGLAATRVAAGRMLDIEPDEVDADELADVAGELVNMIGGGVKSLLPEPCELGLPNVISGDSYSMRLPGCREVSRVDFEWRGSPLAVLILQRMGGVH